MILEQTRNREFEIHLVNFQIRLCCLLRIKRKRGLSEFRQTKVALKQTRKHGFRMSLGGRDLILDLASKHHLLWTCCMIKIGYKPKIGYKIALTIPKMFSPPFGRLDFPVSFHVGFVSVFSLKITKWFDFSSLRNSFHFVFVAHQIILLHFLDWLVAKPPFYLSLF